MAATQDAKCRGFGSSAALAYGVEEDVAPKRPDEEWRDAIQMSCHSGHTRCRRLRFAYSLVGPFVGMSTVSLGRDLYLLEFGASASAMGAILLVSSFVAPSMDTIVGLLQDKGAIFWRCFPMDSWGRRAPWHICHNVLLAFLVLAFFQPPSYDFLVLHSWFAFIWFAGYWCIAASINAFEAARVEIYPFKEERIILEQYCKLAVAIGAGAGTSCVFLCLTVPSRPLLLAASAYGACVTMSSVLATPVLREARSRGDVVSASDSEEKAGRGILTELCASVRSRVVWRMLLLRFLQGLYETITPSVMLYYFTFVYELDKGSRFFWFSIAGTLMGIVELGLAPVWSWLFARTEKPLLFLPVSLRVLDAILTPFLIFAVDSHVMFFVAYLVIWRVCQSPYSYWRIAACGWACDYEDNGREGLLLGSFSMVNNLGRALTNAFIVLGLGWVGLVTTSCLDLDGEAVQEACEYDKIHNQPQSLKTYLVMLVSVVAPSLSILISALTLEFPLRPGSRLLADLLARRHAAAATTAAAPQPPPPPRDHFAAPAPEGSPTILGQEVGPLEATGLEAAVHPTLSWPRVGPAKRPKVTPAEF